jgi:light-regulated signal transduction histidine kinase (bacteriophytochrome)
MFDGDLIEVNDKKNKRLASDMELFRYVLSHDLKKPLRLISYNCNVIKEDDIDVRSEDGRGFLESIESANSDMFKILELLSDYIKLELYPSEKTNFDVGDLLKNIENNLSEIILDKRVIITYGNLPSIYGSYKNLSYVFEQLIKNSINFIDVRQIPEIDISYNIDNKFHYFTVTNNTPVIEEEYYEIIFILFQRLHLAEEVPGFGVGLSISKKMIECDGGNMWIESDANKNKFIFTVPITQSESRNWVGERSWPEERKCKP